MNKKAIKKEIKRLREERDQYSFPQKRFFRINGQIGALEKKLKPNYIKNQTRASHSRKVMQKRSG